MSLMAIKKEREFKFTTKDFNTIREMVYDGTGIKLSDVKEDMVYSRLSKRLRVTGMTQFSDYCDFLQDNKNSDEYTNFTNAITTNLTSFFREKHHFEHLKDTLLPALVKSNTNKKIRIWSAGCSTGEEPYSLAITIKEFFKNDDSWDIKILATDLDTNVLEKAASGVYTEDRIENLSKAMMSRWFRKGQKDNAGLVMASPELRDLISFRQLNLMQGWPMKGPFDFIFCRNVVIYFDKPTQKKLVERYSSLTREKGHLFMGHSESLNNVTNDYELIGHTIYQKNR